MVIAESQSFEWDTGNKSKNFIKHKVTNEEAEQVFQDPLKYIVIDSLHSKKENRFIIFGHSAAGRIILVAFTMRSNRVRVISARDANKKERKWYEEKISSAKIQK
jgi:uncharacterized DUF497 family protein